MTGQPVGADKLNTSAIMFSVEPEPKYTRHQTQRGALADAQDYGNLFLVKHVSELKLTYQIRILLYRAVCENKKLVIKLPKYAKLHDQLKEFSKVFSRNLKIERY